MSHAIVFSPDAGFTNGAIVVVVDWTVVVVAMTGADVVSELVNSAELHAPTMRSGRQIENRRFTW